MAGGSNGGITETTVGLEHEDFQEVDVWAKMQARSQCSSSNPKPRKNTNRLPATQRGIPIGGGLQDLSGCIPTRQSSAPVNIPDWSKILKKPGPNKNPWDDAWDDNVDGGGSEFRHGRGGDVDNDEDGDDDLVPPHEYLAKRVARSQIASFSMCEGVGRTLKGRDLSNMRNAILSKTGFLE